MSTAIHPSKLSEVKLRAKPLRSLYNEISIAANRYSTVDFDFCDYETIQVILKRIQKTSSSIMTSTAGDCVGILNTEGVSISDLRRLLYLFLPELLELTSKVDLQRQLVKFIPIVTIQSPPISKCTSNECASCGSKPKWFKKKFGTCYWCSRSFCGDCPLKQGNYPRIGSGLHSLCSGCIVDLTRADAEDWAESSIKFLAKADDESIMASLGCASIAMALGSNSHDLLRKMARELHNRNNHEVAYNIISLEISENEDNATTKQQMKAHLLASSILLSMAKVQTKTHDERWNFALASKEAYLTAACMIIEQDAELLDNRVKEVDKIVQDLLEEKKRKNELSVLQHVKALETFWMQRDILGILTYLKEKSVIHTNAAILQEDVVLQAFQNFLKNKEPYLPKMLPEDRHALCFLKGVLEIKEKKIEAAFADIESAAWSHSTSNIPDDAILGTCLHAVTDKDADFYSFKTLKEIFKAGSEKVLFSSPPMKFEDLEHSATLLFPSDSELTPPFGANWPSLSVVGHNSVCHKKYEEAVLKLYHEKKWSRLQVAWAYIDEFSGCEHPAEMAVCYLHAAMWIVSILTPNSRIDAKTLYGLKCVVMRLLQTAYAITFKVLNPGMELYVIRLIIGMMRKIAQMPGSRLVLSDEDLEFLLILLKRLEKVSRLFPFWNPPKVSISEAVMFNIITRKLHSNFILGLQDIEREHCPLTSIDLKYQLYENDLRCLLPLDNPTDCRARAMEDLLLSQGWSWSDVAHTMSSTLTTRDANGWIMQSTRLGIPQQYSEITGFVIDIDPEHPSIELLVVEANQRNRKIGLFSQEDINIILQLESSDYPLFFSLDPPNHDLNKQYHPFQQWRYATEKIKDTEVLNTMFITDYMMKSFTVGSDVSSLPPFKQRPCKDGLTKKLPPHLQQAIRSIRERGGFHSQSSHRFWIEAKEMKYDCQQNGSKIAFYFGEMEMIVKSHALNRRTDGELDDTDKDDDPNSPEAQFARDMTNHYEELSIFFPQFARLRQLSKLQIFAMFLDSVLQSLKDSSEGKNIKLPNELVKKIQEDARKQHHTNITKALNSIKGEVGAWPKAENSSYVQSKVSEIKNEMRSRMRQEEERLRRIHGYNIFIDNSDANRALDNVEYEVLKALRKNDEDTLNQIIHALKDVVKIQQDHTLKQYVRRWLATTSQSSRYTFHSSTPQEELIQFICCHLPIPTREEIHKEVLDYHRQKYRTLQNLCSRFQIKTQQVPNTCKWVPAAISSEGLSISYGGVAFTPKVLPVREGERLYRPTNVTSVPIQKRVIIVGKQTSSTYITPRGVSYDKTSGGQSSVRTEPMRKTISAISKGTTTKSPSVNPSNFRRTNSTQLNTQVDKFIRGTEAKSFTEPRAASAGGGSGKPPRGGGPPTGPPSDGSGWKKGLPSSGTNGIYKLIDTKTGKVYIGRSCNITRRVGEHQRDVRNSKKTVGKHFSSSENIEVQYLELPQNFDRRTMQFYEQKCLENARRSLGKGKVINAINAMSIARFEQMARELSQE